MYRSLSVTHPFRARVVSVLVLTNAYCTVRSFSQLGERSTWAYATRQAPKATVYYVFYIALVNCFRGDSKNQYLPLPRFWWLK